MTNFGYTLMTEQSGSKDLVRDVISAEERGFDFEVCSDHFSPWLMDKFPIGAVMNRSLTVKTGQCHVQRYMRPLLGCIRSGDIDPTIIVSHHLSLDQAAHGYEIFKHKQDHCTKVILNP